jgi:hypothetical protein
LDLNPLLLFSIWAALTTWVLVYAKHCAMPLYEELRRWVMVRNR